MANHYHSDPLTVAILIVLAFIVSGIFLVLWLRHPTSLPLKISLDWGWRLRGRRLPGDNKTLRGLVVIIPATGLSFLVIALLRPILPTWFSEGVWQLSPGVFAIIGLLAGAGFMLGELPNSFIKRQCDIPPGGILRRFILRALSSVTDRIDSVLGVLFKISIVVPVPWQTWVYSLLLGPGIHSLFSIWLFRVKVKARAG